MTKTLNTILLIIVFTQTTYTQSNTQPNTSPSTSISSTSNSTPSPSPKPLPCSKSSKGDTLSYLSIPDRPANAMTGSAFVEQVTGWGVEEREKAVLREILSGNVPSFSRRLRSIKINRTLDNKYYKLIYFAACDYMAIGSDQDYLYIPLTPSTAQYLADSLDCLLPTKKIVDDIYMNSEIKLSPQPIPPSEKMTTIPVFAQHTDSILLQLSNLGFDRSASDIIAGHKKDIILSNEIYSPERNSGRVVIYGWHKSENYPIQPVYNGHIAAYVDYSHGVRFISEAAFLNGNPIQMDDILMDPVLSAMLSNEGVISKPFYPESQFYHQD